ncbi:MAG TPA: discoidin domain-containing protein, partial [Ferruginibacter sp.]|nr:discoidin domain-containing protein [Ferruginibacter sp.]
SFKPGGFSRGAGHGSSFTDNQQRWWHVSTSIVCVKNTFERRIGIWPAGFDQDDMMYTETAFGDYPTYLPAERTNSKIAPGWMLLNYKKPVTVSSTLGSYAANNAVDENIKTYWSATSANKGEWIQTDLGSVSSLHAIQINYADQDVETSFLGKSLGVFHQYKLYYSVDGKKWNVLVDKSANKTDVPHDYIELEKPVEARYLKLENIHMPTGKFAISGLRAFGFGHGAKPANVQNFIVLRTEKDKRSAYIKWRPVDNADAYVIYYGTAPDKLYNAVMVHDFNEYWFKAMDKNKTYYFSIVAINENGVSDRSTITKAE